MLVTCQGHMWHMSGNVCVVVCCEYHGIIYVLLYALISFPPSTVHLISVELRLGLEGNCRVDVMIVQDFRVPGRWLAKLARDSKLASPRSLHHDLPRINGEFGVVEAPVELLVGHRLVGGIVVRGKVLMRQGLSGSYPLLGVKD